jgi:hypothetical protein
MKHLFLVSLFALLLNIGPANAQFQVNRVQNNNADLSTLEGVVLSNGRSSMMILANATIQRPGGPANAVTANAVVAPTFLSKVGPYEIHRVTPTPVAASANAQQGITVNGQSLPLFANIGTGQDFVGAAYLNDTQQIGLISKELSAKFKTAAIPADYAGLGAKELVPRSGLYIFTASDIYAWIKLLSRLQADPQVSMVEPRIVTEFAQPQ